MPQAAAAATVIAAAVPTESREQDMSSPVDTSSGRTGGSGGGRTKRMRTSFKHQQLKKMKSYFAMNHNPDSKALKELSLETGLSKRVLQVWFQNARAKWRRSILRQGAAGPDVVKEPTSLTELPELSSSTSDASPSSYSLPFDTGSSSNSCPHEVTSCTTPLVSSGYTGWQWREDDASLDIIQTPSLEENDMNYNSHAQPESHIHSLDTHTLPNYSDILTPRLLRGSKAKGPKKAPQKRGRKPMTAKMMKYNDEDE